MRCGGADLSRVVRQFPTPLYCYDSQSIRERFHLLSSVFAGQTHTICYAVKANSSLAILRMLAKCGSGFDVVSGGEIERVRRAAPDALGRVVFSGVGKTAEEMDLALQAGILLFHVESGGELALLGQRAKKLRTKARVSLRVNPDVFTETHPYISTGLREHKFGVPIREARRLYASFTNDRWLTAAGVSVHIGSQIRDTQSFALAVGRVAALSRQLRDGGLPIQYLDAGGGLGVEYRAGRGFDATRVAEKYASGLVRALRAETRDQPIHLLLEPGRFLVAQAGALLTRVLYVKRNGKKTFIITDAGMNDLVRPALYGAHHAIVPLTPRQGRLRNVDIVGPVCETGDFFARDRSMPPVEPGDFLAVLDAGAYGMSLASNYNSRGFPAEVLVDGKKIRLVRERAAVGDLMRGEVF